MSVKENIEILRRRIDRCAARVQRNADEIQIVAVAKTFPAASIEEAISCGIAIIGENRVQEAIEKYRIIGDRVTWHMVGHLQTNKVKDALKIFSMIQSLDSLRLAQEIEKRANTKVDCLIEVNTSGESTKFGLSPNDVLDFYGSICAFRHINIQGLMTIGPGWAVEDPEASRLCFRILRGLQEELAQEYDRPFPILSMGMTSDFEVAIEEGSDMIRIGTALFGPRT
ncbi:MAG: YggS family pyridoxal phosphate-dependent enzyme [candidate division WOR-3 bacterium]|nr:MAG: YggS family pyridoxal phosphate-dependent enzyme [candidate division WOR-3 bacterium]